MLRGSDKSGKVILCSQRNHNTHQTVPSLSYIWSGTRRFQSLYTEYNIYGTWSWRPHAPLLTMPPLHCLVDHENATDRSQRYLVSHKSLFIYIFLLTSFAKACMVATILNGNFALIHTVVFVICWRSCYDPQGSTRTA